MLHEAIQWLYLNSKKIASLQVKLMIMLLLSFATLLKFSNEEFDTHGKDDGEAVFEYLNKKSWRRGKKDEQFDELKQSLPYSEKLVLDSFTSEEVTKNVVLSKIREFPDLNKNDLSTAVIAEFTLNKLLDDVEKTSKHQQDQKKKNSLHRSKDWNAQEITTQS